MGFDLHDKQRMLTALPHARIASRPARKPCTSARRPCASRTVAALRLTFVMAIVAVSATADADEPIALPSPLRVADVVRLAKERRDEVIAAHARAGAAAQRPEIMSALDDPQVFPSVDHAPFRGGGADVSFTIEQSFPLSHIRGHRRHAAEADARRELAEADRVGLDVKLDAAAAFWMLAETRATAAVIAEQHGLADQMVAAALARYATSTAAQADVLRAQLEVARLDGETRALVAETRAAEIMLNTSLARAIDARIPELDATLSDLAPDAGTTLAATATERRPELRAGRADVARAEAEVAVMDAMYTPMAMVRTGPAYTMQDGAGWMLMVGISIPLWRGKLRAGVAEARAMVDMSRADLMATRRQIGGDAAAARERVAAARERFVTLRDIIIPHAKQAVTATLAGYAGSQLPLISVIEASQMLWSAERDLVMARAELGLAWARLRRATGEE